MPKPNEQQSQQAQGTPEEAQLAATINNIIDKQLAPLRDAVGQKATNNMGTPPADNAHHPVTGKEASEGTGIDLGRLVVCSYQSQMVDRYRGKSPADVAKQHGYGRVERALRESDGQVQNFMQRALNSTSLGAGGIFVETTIAEEVIDLLRPKVWIRQRAQEIPLVAGADFNKQLGDGVAYYKGELDAITPSEQSFGRSSMVERELTALTPISNRLLQLGGSRVESMVRDSIVKVMALKENLTFYRSAGANGAPKGIRSQVAASQLFNATQAGATATLAEVRADLQRTMLKLANADVPMLDPAWFLSPSTKAFLMSITDGNGNAVYEAQLSNNTLLGYPVDTSTQVPINLGAGGDETEVGFVDYSESIIGQGDMFLEVFPNGTYEVGGQVLSGVTRNQTVIRAITYHDLIMKHDKSAAFMQCKWRA